MTAYLLETCLYLWDKQTVAMVYGDYIDDQDVPLHRLGIPVGVDQLAHQLLALIYLVEIKFVLVKLLLDGHHALRWPLKSGPLQLGLHQVAKLALHHPLLDVVRVVPEQNPKVGKNINTIQLPEVAFLHEPVPPLHHHLGQLQAVYDALVIQLTGVVPDHRVVLHGVVTGYRSWS